ncbi:hypothetical protein EC988_001389 [Linderina pennispora]|nr:hypothetical protein EC988_001389 [Linderina pennispora]
MGDAAESRQAQAKGRVIFNVLSYIIGFIGSAAAQITAAMAIISCFQMQAGITYIDVILLMPALDSLSDALSSAGAALDNATQLYAQLMQYCKLFGNQTSGITRISKRPDGMAVYLYGASFAWSAGKSPVLEDITLEIRHGSMTAVIGRVGSGKSSLLAAMSGSLLRCSGVAAVSGNAFLVDSDPWILEGTFRDNVVMDQPFDDSRYWRVIESCALSSVVRNWPNGDMEIVDQYMLSTSQRSLLSLARAIYASADVLLIDDIFSYIDLRTRDKLLGGVLSTDSNRTLVVVSRSKPIVSLASRVVRVENQRVSVAKQTPKQWKTDCLFIPEYFDGSMSPSAGSTFSDSTALDATAAAGGRNKCHLPQPSLEWWHVAKYSALCGYLWMVIALAVQGVGLYTALYVDGYRKELILGTGSHQGVSRALYDYLVSDVIVSIIQQQLVACECWIRRGLWSEQAKEAIADKLMNAVRYSEIQIDSAFRDCACTLLTKGCYVLSTELPEQLSQRAMLILRSAYITVQILYALPVLGLFAVPLVISYIGMQLWWKATVAKRGLVSDHAGVADDLEDQNETSSPFCSVTMSSVDAQRGSIVGQAESKRDDCIAFVESAIGDIFAAIANTGWLLWPFLSQRLTGSGHFTPADVDISIRLSELISLLSTERKPLWPLLSVLPKYFAFTSRTEPPIGASSEELPLVAGGKIVLECRNIGLQFSGCSEPLCSNISFTLRTGEQLAVIGHNGQGKSMLFRSLFRLQSPGSALGSVAINGVEMSTIADSEIACLAEFVTADSVIFDASLRKNLDPLGSFTDAELSSVMQRARIPEIMPQMTLDTQVACPSTCQKQIISLCRAVLSKRPVVVFDQLTAGMDALTQKAVHAVVVGEFADRAVINITNQPSEVMSNSYVVAVH